jgi:hypothetical protein
MDKMLLGRAMPIHIGKLFLTFLTRTHRAVRTGKQHLKPKHFLVAGGAAFVCISLAYTVSFYWPRTITFSYAGGNCFTNPVLLPALTTKKTATSFDASPGRTISIGNYPIYSHATCVTPTGAPKENAAEAIALKMPGNILLKKSITIKSGEYPVLHSKTIPGKPMSTKDPLALSLTSSDTVFEYQLNANGLKAPCGKQDRLLLCDVPKLNLAQAKQYDFTLVQLFRGRPVKTILERKLATVEPVQIIGTSIAGDQTVYDIPTELTLTLNKPAESIGAIKLLATTGEAVQETPITTSLDKAVLTVRFTQPLARSATLSLSIEHISAEDGGYLPAPFSLAFKTSGGPKVLGVNIGSAKVQPGGSVVLTFDSAMAAGQDLAKFIRIESGSGIVSATFSLQGRKVTIRPVALPRCTAFTVKVLDGLKNEFGVSGGSSWQFGSRTLCQTVFSIGSSVQGRGITGYRFGDGPNKIIFVGGTHGDERSSVQILNSWIDQLELNPTRIPAHQTIIVIPNLNPDGYAANRRTNANNVDLNRNFPSNNWKSGVTMPDQSYLEHGGGTHPLSEPESSALANYVTSQGPRLVLTYHAAGSVVIPNHSGDSNAIAIEYGKQSTVGYRSDGNGLFHYDTTGAFEDWLHDKRGIPALLIELKTRTSSDFSGHRNALWYIAQL